MGKERERVGEVHQSGFSLGKVSRQALGMPVRAAEHWAGQAVVAVTLAPAPPPPTVRSPPLPTQESHRGTTDDMKM